MGRRVVLREWERGRARGIEFEIRACFGSRFYTRAEAEAAAAAQEAAAVAADPQASGGSRNAIIYSAMQVQVCASNPAVALFFFAQQSLFPLTAVFLTSCMHPCLQLGCCRPCRRHS